MKKLIYIYCLLIAISAITAYASRSRSTARSSSSTGRTSRRDYTIQNLKQEKKDLQQIIKLQENAMELLSSEIKRLNLIVKKSDVNPLLLKLQRIQSPLKNGQILFFDDGDDVKINQVIDERTFLAELTIRKLAGYEWVAASETVFITNTNTSGLTDDKVVKFPSDTFFAITGTKTYENVAGSSNTVFVLEHLSESDIAPKSKFLTL